MGDAKGDTTGVEEALEPLWWKWWWWGFGFTFSNIDGIWWLCEFACTNKGWLFLLEAPSCSVVTVTLSTEETCIVVFGPWGPPDDTSWVSICATDGGGLVTPSTMELLPTSSSSWSGATSSCLVVWACWSTRICLCCSTWTWWFCCCWAASRANIFCLVFSWNQPNLLFFTIRFTLG